MIRKHDWAKELRNEPTPRREGHIEGTDDLEGTNDTKGATIAHHMSDQESTSTHKAPVLPDGERPGLFNNKAFEEDFETIVDFLVSGEADSGGEDEVWAILSHRVRLLSMHMFVRTYRNCQRECRTAALWSEFLEQHASRITEEVARRCVAPAVVPAVASATTG